MARNNSKLIADSLERVKKKAKKGVIQSSQISRNDRERLIDHEYLKKIIKGWYLLSMPLPEKGESTAWYASFWDFIEIYLTERFGDQYCLSAESSLWIHLGACNVPRQVIVIINIGGPSVLDLPHDTSLLMYPSSKRIPKSTTKVKDINVMTLPTCLSHIKPAFFRKYPSEAELALRLIQSGDEISKFLIEGGYQSAANRIVGAYQFLKDNEKAQIIIEHFKAAGYRITPKNPFANSTQYFLRNKYVSSPYAARIESMWNQFREDVLAVIPSSSGRPKDANKVLDQIEVIYEHDAYNSLSIEGYKVTHNLIEKIRSGEWNPEIDPQDKINLDALAAKGYQQAFSTVKESIKKILQGKSVGEVINSDHQKWYRELFSPSISAGIINYQDLIGYRNNQVYIRGSRHIPLPHTAVVDAIESLFNLIDNETTASVKAVLGHFLFVYIHPYMDGNGRIARFLMNILLTSGGYNWTIIENSKRTKYMDTLEEASVKRNIKPFVEFVYEEMQIDWGNKK